MPEASANPVSLRVVVAVGLACALSLPVSIGAWADSTLAPSHRVLLSSDGPTTLLSQAVTAAGGQVVQTYEIAGSVLADLPEGVTAPQGSFAIPDMVMRFNSVPTAAVTSDDVNTFRQTIGAAEAANGSGVTVAVVDTGVDPAADVDVSDRVNVSDGPAGDGLGHGTFMAGLVAGDDDQFGGVAPEARIMDVQVANQDGSTNLSKVLAGLQEVADQRADDPSLQVAMLALSTDSPLPPWIDPMTRSLDQLWARGVTVVVAAGNEGAREVPSPASDPLLLVVGAQDEADTPTIDDDTVADFSSFGRAFGEKRPDLVAPGVSLISTASKESTAYTGNPGSHVGNDFMKGTGTSMSAAVTAGAVAALVGERPQLTPDQVKRLLIGTANRTPALKTSKGGGAGALDLATAMSTPLGSVPPLSQENPDVGRFGPAEQDAQAWADFAEGWESGDLRAVAKAWVAMSPQTRKWAANAWSIAALMRALQADDDTFDGRRWAGRRWATEDWNGRRWATDEWVGRRWADEQWLSEVWDGRRWAGRRWAASDWLAFAWSLREAADDPELQDLWLDEQWEGRRWAGRRWAATDWVGRRWASDAWDGRRWADYTWDGRRWATGEWTGRRWAEFSFEGRRWATEDWNGRRWATLGW